VADFSESSSTASLKLRFRPPSRISNAARDSGGGAF